MKGELDEAKCRLYGLLHAKGGDLTENEAEVFFLLSLDPAIRSRISGRPEDDYPEDLRQKIKRAVSGMAEGGG